MTQDTAPARYRCGIDQDGNVRLAGHVALVQRAAGRYLVQRAADGPHRSQLPVALHLWADEHQLEAWRRRAERREHLDEPAAPRELAFALVARANEPHDPSISGATAAR